MATKRKAISKKVRFDIFKRDLFTCQYCGSTPPGVILHVDHIVPVAKGGGNQDDNLITSCSACNLGKGAGSLGVAPMSLSDKAAETREREEQILGYQKIMALSRDRIESEAWTVANLMINAGTYYIHEFDRGWFQSIKRFVKELGVYSCIDSMELAISKQPRHSASAFRYFCGACWGKIRELKSHG